MPFEQKRIDHESGVVILALSGTLTMGNELKQLEFVVDRLLGEQRNKIVFDFTEVAYLDSAAVGTIVHCKGKVAGAAGQLRLANLSARVGEIFRVTKIYDVLSPDASRADAIAVLTAGA